MDSDKSITLEFINPEYEYYSTELYPLLYDSSFNKNLFTLQNEEHYLTGALEPSIEEFNNVPIAPSISSKNYRSYSPRALIAQNNFPVPLSQGQQGSCVAWAVGFASKSYFEKQERNWNLGYQNCLGMYSHKYEHIFSPAFIYNKINNGEDEGSSFIDALKLLKNTGICTWNYMPYDENDYTTLPNSTAINNAQQYKIINYYRINNSYGTFTTNEILIMKEYLDNGTPIIIAVVADSNLHYPNETNNLGEFVWNTVGTVSAGHGMCIIGYEENYGFKVMNSWGTYWGNDGFIWISFDLFQNHVGNEAYIMID